LAWLCQPEVVKEFGEISEAIWRFAELGLHEFKSSALLVKTLEKEGFHVDTGLAGMPTCFVASYGTGQPVIGILAEFDALPTLSQRSGVSSKEPVVEGAPGHGCGHNLMGSAATAAAIAVKRCMEKYHLHGTVKLFGSPAEETLISRPYMVRAGLSTTSMRSSTTTPAAASRRLTASRAPPCLPWSSSSRARPPTAAAVPGPAAAPSTRSRS
jgi:aminobenzoyl-glutamate utilization protein B